MKRTYSKPMILVERFAANECISACQYKFTCDAPRGALFQDNNNDGIANKGDVLLNPGKYSGGIFFGEWSYNEYVPCYKEYTIDKNQITNGVVVEWFSFNRAKKRYGRGEEEAARTDFKWENFNANNCTPVGIYNSGTDLHATENPVVVNRS